MSIRVQNMFIPNGNLDQTGPATRADGYYGFSNGFHTVAFVHTFPNPTLL